MLFKLNILIISNVILFVSLVNSQATDDRPCPLAYKCSNNEDIVWAVGEQKCYVYRNQCQLNNENCQRQNRYESVLKIVSKAECQKLCPQFCTFEYKPVCATYNDKQQTFPNTCELESHICNSGEIYAFPRSGECDGTVA